MNNLLDLSGKTAVVTGGSRGVGRATALLLAKAGASVGIGFRSREDDAAETVRDLKAFGVHAWDESGDLGDPGDSAGLFQKPTGSSMAWTSS